ncbi:hypothetical protein [Allokutzneria sp. NRRL B-24872]|uniref:hypothetical protein n=1 Tax=Allokutzneria sp. NRRL B-24872 TaxID=1137961 RepID=UPI000A3C51AF|nr:hypothetical protein [Allokutzneria sp. NRRL B-24872]
MTVPSGDAHVLYVPTGATAARIAFCGAVVAVACGTPAIRALALRGTAADRLAYQLLIVAYVVVMSTGVVLWS